MNDSTLEIVDKAKIIDKYLIEMFVFSMIGVTNNSKIYAIKKSEVSESNPAIAMQFYYNWKTNKCFLELRLNELFRNTYDENLAPIKNAYDIRLADNFKSDIKSWLERIFPEDGRNENCDGSQLLSPYTIGYWKSLSGRFDFITDKIKILKDYNDLVFPTYPAEYLIKKEQLWNDYYNDIIDFDTFNQKMYELNVEYDIKLDQKPRKDFEDFIETIKGINELYSQVQLTEEQKAEFINNYMEIIAQFGSNPELLEEKLNELYDETGIIRELNNKIPEIFELYKTEYENFFEKPLTTMNLVNDLPEFQENEEVWSFSGYFNFGNVADPDDESESIMVLSFYDILIKEESVEENED